MTDSIIQKLSIDTLFIMEKLKTKKEIACEFGISTKTLYRWLKANNIKIPRGLINEIDQKKIAEKLSNSKMS